MMEATGGYSLWTYLSMAITICVVGGIFLGVLILIWRKVFSKLP